MIIVEKGDRIQIENNLYFDVLWPKKKLLKDNILNNNSIVAKLHYNEISMLFTGDIEKEAEDTILEENINIDADILKIAHHGSKTSTTDKFLSKVNPKIALIGVGENNNFGHPSEDVITRLNNKHINIYRTDMYGEIEILINHNGKIRVKKHINS